jgi:hypothetical protein
MGRQVEGQEQEVDKDKNKKLTFGEYKARFPFAFTASYNGL